MPACLLIAEVKTNQPCTLNGPWNRPDFEIVHRVLAAIGCLPADHIEQAAADIYRAGIHVSKFGLRIRLVAVGRERSEELERDDARQSAVWPAVRRGR